MLPDAVVNTFVVPAQDNHILHTRNLIGIALVQDFAVGRGVDNLVVFPLALEMIYEIIDRFDFHNHTGIPAKGVVVYLLVIATAPVVQVVDVNLYQTLVPGPFYDGIIERAVQQLRHCGNDVESHSTQNY